jgi:iron complex outermembrane receptor protein
VGDFAFNANATARTYYYVAVTNRLKNPGYAVMNDSIKWTPPNGRYAVRVWAANIFDRRYQNNVNESGVGDLQVWAPPRTFGITASMKFGAYK